MRLDQTIRNLTCSDVEILLPVIPLEITGSKKTEFVYLLDFGERGRRGGVI